MMRKLLSIPVLVKSLFVVAILLGMSVTPVHAASSLLNNGSFEDFGYEYIKGGSTTITGWQTVLNGVERANPSVRVGPADVNKVNIGAAKDGSLIVDLAPLSHSGGGIQQTFNTVAGQSYSLSFYGGTLQRFGRDGTAQIDVSVDTSNQTFNVINKASTIAWMPFSLSFKATTPTTTVVFKNLQDAKTHFALIDNVSVQTVP